MLAEGELGLERVVDSVRNESRDLVVLWFAARSDRTRSHDVERNDDSASVIDENRAMRRARATKNGRTWDLNRCNFEEPEGWDRVMM